MSELNEKLAKWAGFYRGTMAYKYKKQIHIWRRPDRKPCRGFLGRPVDSPPYFTSSLDACFEWLVPIFDDKGGYCLHSEYHPITGEFQHHCFVYYMGGHFGWATEKTPALALCRAIEKLIDDEGS